MASLLAFKPLLSLALWPLARLADKPFAAWRRLWAYARLRAAVPGVDASVVVLAMPELHGTRRIGLGKDLYLYPGLYLETQAAGRIEIGDGVVMSRGVHLVAFDRISIGAGSMIGEYASLRDANHRHGAGMDLRHSGHEARPIRLGRNVWIGRGAVVLAGVEIGDGAVVGANAVVTRSVAAGQTVVGVPARPLPPCQLVGGGKGMSVQRLLLVAYQCGPGMGSVSQIGWEWYSRLAQQYHVTLVTHVRNRQAMAAAGAPLGDSEVIYIDTEWFAGPLYRFAKRLFPRSEHSVFLVASLDYFVFDAAAWRLLRRRQKLGERWDILHRVTPVTLAAPTWLGRLGIPTVIGPLNSGLKDPPGFAAIMRQESTWLVNLREFGRWFDGLIGSSRLATRLLVATQVTLAAVPPRHRARCQLMLENGVELDRFEPTPWPAAPGPQQPLEVLFVGRLIPVKALALLIDAIGQLSAAGQAVRLTVVGDGPLRAEWERHAQTRGLGERVHFVGNQTLSDVASFMQRCHVFCLPSVRESGGAVVLEAMASARPVIAIRFGGPAELVDDSVGALVEPTGPQQVTADLADLLQQVIRHPADWAARGQAGRRRVEARYSWNAKVAAAGALYQAILNEGKPL